MAERIKIETLSQLPQAPVTMDSMAWNAMAKLSGLGASVLLELAVSQGADWCGPPVDIDLLEALDPQTVRLSRFMPSEAENTSAQAEAARCMSCGYCILCGACEEFCPDLCARPDPNTGQVNIDLEHCKGCGLCTAECPRGMISMEHPA